LSERRLLMFKKFIVAMSILAALTLAGGTLGSLTPRVLAHGHGHDCCGHCGHFVCPGECGRCEECLARQRAERERARGVVAKCEKCGHEECTGNCKRCVECLAEKLEKLEKERKGEK
jgi:hypothetical protein